MGNRLGDWVDERLGWPTAIRNALLQRVPRLSWGHVLGSATLVALVILILTGVLLSLSYVPSPEEAHTTIEYITKELPFGAVIRNLHHFIAHVWLVPSLIITVVVMHLRLVHKHGISSVPRRGE